MSLYVYGVAGQSRAGDEADLAGRLAGLGLGGGDVEVIRTGDMMVLVSTVEAGDVFVPTPSDLLAHQKVLTTAMQDRDVLPFRFGMIARDREELAAVIAGCRSDLLTALERVRGKEEAVLKVFWLQGAVRREIERELGDIRDLGDRTEGDGARRLLALEVGQRVEACLERWKATHIKRICEELRPFSADQRMHEPLGARMILNAAFLVERTRRWAFAEKVRKLEALYADRLEIRCLVGLPPYSFADVRLR